MPMLLRSDSRTAALYPEIALLHLGARLQGRSVAPPPHLALLEHEVAVSELGQRLDLLVDDDDRQAGAFQRVQAGPDLLADDGCEPLRRLVEDEEARICHERAADGQHLLLAAGKLRAAVRQARAKPREEVEHALDGPGLARVSAIG